MDFWGQMGKGDLASPVSPEIRLRRKRKKDGISDFQKACPLLLGTTGFS